MGEVLVKIDFNEISRLAQKWAQDHKLSFTETPSIKSDKNIDFENQNQLRAKGKFYSAIWQSKVIPDGHAVKMILKPNQYLIGILYLIIFAGLWYALKTMTDTIDVYNFSNLSSFILSAVFVILILWWKDNKLTAKMTRLENSFWDILKSAYDTKILSRPEGNLSIGKLKLSTELAYAFSVIYACSVFLGIPGFWVSLLLSLFVLSMMIGKLKQNDNPHWHWRFWIMGNLSRWTYLMIAVTGFMFVLLAMEFFISLEMYKSEINLSVKQAIHQGSLRDISPVAAKPLEADARRLLRELALSGVPDLKGKTDKESEDSRQIMFYACSSMLLVLIIISICFLVFMQLYNLLTSHKIWYNEMKKSQIPSVPYLPMAWQWKTPITLRAIVLLHYVCGGIINLSTAVFCFSGLSYVFIGETFFIPKLANLWSWIFVPGKMIFGETGGQVVGIFFVLCINLPFLILLGAHLRRLLKNIFLVYRVLSQLFSKFKSEELFIIDFVKKICSKAGINEPVIMVKDDKNVVLCLHRLIFSKRAILEISSGTFELLDSAELKVAIAHEIGHIKQGIWKVEALKFLSSLALFPNYYLTLCLNWSGQEMESDRFALSVTRNPQTLKQALIKISTAQMSYLKSVSSNPNADSIARKRKLFIGRLKEKWYTATMSVRFFFGDSLFGYAHPYLSERLDAIDTYKDILDEPS